MRLDCASINADEKLLGTKVEHMSVDKISIDGEQKLIDGE
jgi:hypothetical protein